MYVLAKLDVAKALGPNEDSINTAEAIAKVVGADPSALYRLMHSTAVEGLFREIIDDTKTGVFGHTPLSMELLDPLTRDQTLCFCGPGFYRGWESLEESIKTGKCQYQKATGYVDYWDFLTKHPDDEYIFKRSMSSITINSVKRLSELGDFKQFNVVCDVGASEGILLKEILRTYPTIKKGIAFDRPTVINKNVHEANLDPRFSEVTGDFFVSVPAADCYILKSILHDWNDESSAAILNTLGRSLNPGGKVYIMDYVIGLPGYTAAQESHIAWLDMHMLQMVDGKERSKKDFDDLCKKTPFHVENIIISQLKADMWLSNIVVLTK
ncbi:hypothetical protein SAMD00019534_008580 [Acytostelium subglobosum LB1]|uniref:hypothetical protein n=1 Tax=Acytostelium subglobosum LB1 TaxID=1410327 RepID=UPI0006449977|nr:hypothetical protein SAMD00019534_008580 [Acytostelium subglobosum LB1]GAM17683.1 hypothetical protein SAMD00019534_008580 [Acytostelium subglobosum LB1]|eukprot:XP_012758279.1 hypothetical protein SAMD00019534_008580 [Acytostelium subglobosum LB1]